MRTLVLWLGIIFLAPAVPAQADAPHSARSAPVLLDADGQEIGVLVSLVERSGSSVGIAPWAIIGVESDSREFGVELDSKGEFQSSCGNWSLLCFEDSSCSGQPYLLANPGCGVEILGLELAGIVGDQAWLPIDRTGGGRWVEVYSASLGHDTCIPQLGVQVFAVPAEEVLDLTSFTAPYRLTLQPSKRNPR